MEVELFSLRGIELFVFGDACDVLHGLMWKHESTGFVDQVKLRASCLKNFEEKLGTVVIEEVVIHVGA